MPSIPIYNIFNTDQGILNNAKAKVIKLLSVKFSNDVLLQDVDITNGEANNIASNFVLQLQNLLSQFDKLKLLITTYSATPSATSAPPNSIFVNFPSSTTFDTFVSTLTFIDTQLNKLVAEYYSFSSSIDYVSSENINLIKSLLEELKIKFNNLFTTFTFPPPAPPTPAPSIPPTPPAPPRPPAPTTGDMQTQTMPPPPTGETQTQTMPPPRGETQTQTPAPPTTEEMETQTALQSLTSTASQVADDLIELRSVSINFTPRMKTQEVQSIIKDVVDSSTQATEELKVLKNQATEILLPEMNEAQAQTLNEMTDNAIQATTELKDFTEQAGTSIQNLKNKDIQTAIKQYTEQAIDATEDLRKFLSTGIQTEPSMEDVNKRQTEFSVEDASKRNLEYRRRLEQLRDRFIGNQTTPAPTPPFSPSTPIQTTTQVLEPETPETPMGVVSPIERMESIMTANTEDFEDAQEDINEETPEGEIEMEFEIPEIQERYEDLVVSGAMNELIKEINENPKWDVDEVFLIKDAINSLGMVELDEDQDREQTEKDFFYLLNILKELGSFPNPDSDTGKKLSLIFGRDIVEDRFNKKVDESMTIPLKDIDSADVKKMVLLKKISPRAKKYTITESAPDEAPKMEISNPQLKELYTSVLKPTIKLIERNPEWNITEDMLVKIANNLPERAIGVSKQTQAESDAIFIENRVKDLGKYPTPDSEEGRILSAILGDDLIEKRFIDKMKERGLLGVDEVFYRYIPDTRSKKGKEAIEKYGFKKADEYRSAFGEQRRKLNILPPPVGEDLNKLAKDYGFKGIVAYRTAYNEQEQRKGNQRLQGRGIEKEELKGGAFTSPLWITIDNVPFPDKNKNIQIQGILNSISNHIDALNEAIDNAIIDYNQKTTEDNVQRMIAVDVKTQPQMRLRGGRRVYSVNDCRECQMYI